MAGKQCVYVVARIHSKELSLLPGAFLEQLTAAKSCDEYVRFFTEKGRGDDSTKDVEVILTTEWRKAWELISGLVEDISIFDVFPYANDYHNLKAIIEGVRMGHEYPGVYIDQGTVDVELIYDAVEDKEFQNLPETVRVPAGEAYKTLPYTQDGQLCDIIIDRAALEAIYYVGKPLGGGFLRLYTGLTVAAADIKATVRVPRTGRDRVFLEQALTPCDTLDTVYLAQAAIKEVDTIGIYLESTTYADTIEELHRSPSAFER